MKTFAIMGRVKDGPKGHSWRDVCRKIKAYTLKQAVVLFRNLYSGKPVQVTGYVDLDSF